MTILFNGRFDQGVSFAAYNRADRAPASADIPPLEGGRPGEYELVPDPAGSGATVARLTMQAAAPGRLELRPFLEDYEGSSGPDWGTRWYAMWMYVPSEPEFQLPPASGTDVDTTEAANNRTLVMQLHQTESVGEPSFPAFQLSVDQNGYVVMLTHDTSHPSVSRVPNLRVLRNLPLRRNTWEEWVLRVRYAYDTNGEMELFRNRRRLFSVTGQPTGYNDEAGPFMKFGLYAYSLASWTQARTVYTRGMVVGDGNSSYLEVAGQIALEPATARGLI